MEPTRAAKEGKARRGVEGGERRVVEEAMKRPRDKKKEGEGCDEGDGTTVVKWMRRAKKRRARENEGERKRVGIERGGTERRMRVVEKVAG